MTKDQLLRLANKAENRIDSWKSGVRKRFSSGRPTIILSYRGFGTPHKIWTRGRVLEDNAISVSQRTDRFWTNLRNTYKRFDSREIPGARVRVCFERNEQVVTADEEGFFESEIALNEPLQSTSLWHDLTLSLIEPQSINLERSHSAGLVMIPFPHAQFGIISDLDDTVIRAESANLFRMLQTTLLKNAHTRLPFTGVAAFYRALHQEGKNPLFYVSSSPWNLYDLLLQFLELHQIPLGPVFLRDWGLSETEFLPTHHRLHKLSLVRKIIDTYPDLRFLLLGDSAQQDPEIYQEIANLYPGRILAIYIRNAGASPLRLKGIEKIATQIAKTGTSLFLCEETGQAAEHAFKQGWIAAESLLKVVSQ